MPMTWPGLRTWQFPCRPQHAQRPPQTEKAPLLSRCLRAPAAARLTPQRSQNSLQVLALHTGNLRAATPSLDTPVVAIYCTFSFAKRCVVGKAGCTHLGIWWVESAEGRTLFISRDVLHAG